MEEKNNEVQMTSDQGIAFHQGALNTLVKEREGLIQMIQVVEATMQSHLQRLKQLGVKISEKNE
jgi:hypothetical protein